MADTESSVEPRLYPIVDEIRWDEKAGLRTGCGVRSQVIDVLKAQIKRRPAMKKVSTEGQNRSRKSLSRS